MQLPQDDRKNSAYKLFNGYTKRNSIANYVQSHGCIGAKIINIVYDADIRVANPQDFISNNFKLERVYYDKTDEKLSKSNSKYVLDKDEAIFWLYTTIREDKLPIFYFNNMIEGGIVMGELFNIIF